MANITKPIILDETGQAIVRALESIAGGIDFEFVEELPSAGVTGKFYFVPNGTEAGNNKYNEYVYDAAHESFELIAANIEIDATPTEGSNNPVSSGGVYTAIQNAVPTVDATPTENSGNPVASGGVFSALAGKQSALTFDNTPTENSGNPVTSGGIYTALQSVQAGTTADVDKIIDGTWTDN